MWHNTVVSEWYLTLGSIRHSGCDLGNVLGHRVLQDERSRRYSLHHAEEEECTENIHSILVLAVPIVLVTLIGNRLELFVMGLLEQMAFWGGLMLLWRNYLLVNGLIRE